MSQSHSLVFALAVRTLKVAKLPDHACVLSFQWAWFGLQINFVFWKSALVNRCWGYTPEAGQVKVKGRARTFLTLRRLSCPCRRQHICQLLFMMFSDWQALIIAEGLTEVRAGRFISGKENLQRKRGTDRKLEGEEWRIVGKKRCRVRVRGNM